MDEQGVQGWFDLKSAILGALLMSSLVFAVNYGHGMVPALIAAGKQVAYTFFVAGFIMQFCRFLAVRGDSDAAARINATLTPTVITVVMVYILHSFRGTPEPVLSTLPVAVLSLLAFFFVSRKIRAER